MSFSHHYEYLRVLTILKEDVDGTDLSVNTGPDPSHFLGHRPCLVTIYVGG
jgi:hypothetical protein